MSKKCEKCGNIPRCTPEELYLRQNGKCYLECIKEGDKYYLCCTDGNDYARTDCLENPTVECSRCMSKFALNLLVVLVRAGLAE